MELEERAKQVLEDRIKRIRDFSKLQPDHPFAVANKHMLDLSTQTKWDSTGTINMTGVVWWALNVSLALGYPNSVIFNATGGPDFDFAIFTSLVTGSFFVDPSTLGGECNFSMEAVAGGEGEVSLNFYDMNWSQTGTFLGAVGGVSLSKVSGSGNITYE
jgi:hypothetical protein